jgi:outer membrane protein TolC
MFLQDGKMWMVRGALASALTSLFLCSVTPAQTPQAQTAPHVFTLDQAVDYALAHYPAVHAALSRIAAAHAGVDVAKTIYLPSVDALWQSNRGTRNNVFGQVLPQSVIPSLTGPVLPFANEGNAWGSAAGVLASWEPFDFGYRAATVNVARAGENTAAAQANITRLDVAVATTNAYLALLAAEQVARAAEANVKRREVLAQSVGVLVQNELRAGADGSRAQADLAQARVRLIQARAAEKSSRAILAALLGIPATDLEIAPGSLLTSTPQAGVPEIPSADNPLVGFQKAQVELVRAQENVLSKTYFPKFAVEGAVSGRGTGAEAGGAIDPGAAGLGLQRGNWAVGVQVTFPVMKIFSIRAQKQVEAANEATEQARYEQTLQDLSGQVAQARANLEGAREVAQNTPVELAAAHDTEQQARARYQSGLATIVEASEAEALLVEAEIDDAIARLSVWRGLAGVAAAQGNLQPFLELVRSEGH